MSWSSSVTDKTLVVVSGTPVPGLDEFVAGLVEHADGDSQIHLLVGGFASVVAGYGKAVQLKRPGRREPFAPLPTPLTSRAALREESELRAVADFMRAGEFSNLVLIGGDGATAVLHRLLPHLPLARRVAFVAKTYDDTLALPPAGRALGADLAADVGESRVSALLDDSAAMGDRLPIVIPHGRGAGFLANRVGRRARLVIVPEQIQSGTTIHQLADLVVANWLVADWRCQTRAMGAPPFVAVVAEGVFPLLEGIEQDVGEMFPTHVPLRRDWSGAISMAFPFWGELLTTLVYRRMGELGVLDGLLARGRKLRVIPHALGYELRSSSIRGLIDEHDEPGAASDADAMGMAVANFLRETNLHDGETRLFYFESEVTAGRPLLEPTSVPWEEFCGARREPPPPRRMSAAEVAECPRLLTARDLGSGSSLSRALADGEMLGDAEQIRGLFAGLTL